MNEYFQEKFPELDFSMEKHIIPRIQDLIIDSILAVRADLNANKKNDFFELFGFDFLIDEDFRTWLIECNTNPYLGIPNDFIRKLLPQMVDDMLSIVLDEKFPSVPASQPNERKNGFKLLYRNLNHKDEDVKGKCKAKEKCNKCKKAWG